MGTPEKGSDAGKSAGKRVITESEKGIESGIGDRKRSEKGISTGLPHERWALRRG
jgi:hypothetical protein